MRRVDAAIIGTGQASPALAAALAERGQHVVVFEGDLVGGSCVNAGCTPTKTLRKSARVAHLARRASEFGVRVGEVEVDFVAAMTRVARVVATSRSSVTKWMEDTERVSLVRAFAHLDGREGGRFIVRGGDATVAATHIYLNTGTRPRVPDIEGIETVPYLTNETVLALRERPRHLAVLGGSYIGLELGQIFRRLGSEVTIIEPGPAVASREDPDVSARLATMLQDEGVQVLVGHAAERVLPMEEGGPGAHELRLHLRQEATGAVRVIHASHLLVATGRTPATATLGLDSVGVTRDERGFVPTNGRLETNVPGIWALGDINGRGAFTHTSYQDHEIVVANLDGGERSADGRVTTYAMFTDPPLGRVGITETEARAQMAEGRRFLVAEFEMANVSRAKEEGELTGVLKVVVDAKTRQFAGATLLGLGADEVVQVIGALMAAGAPYEVLRDALPVHPTVTEFFPTILKQLKPLA
jgi:pyruvate/2-oxoglutarate dehydrogenase complex dihydrolipoamide dehydrogenase (E3) component